jgi:hypothetical protein
MTTSRYLEYAAAYTLEYSTLSSTSTDKLTFKMSLNLGIFEGASF